MLKFNHRAIKQYREALKISQTDLAHIMGVRRQRVQQIENGENRLNLRTLEKLWAALGVNDPTPFFFMKSQTACRHCDCKLS